MISFSQFIWEPYTNEVLELLAPICRSDAHIWRTVAPLICFDIVEWHHPERVLRQFGHGQMIPGSCDFDVQLHKTDRRGKSGHDWLAHHGQQVAMWNAREQSVVDAQHIQDSPALRAQYMDWYKRITRLVISPPTRTPSGAYQPVASDLHMMVGVKVHKNNNYINHVILYAILTCSHPFCRGILWLTQLNKGDR